MSVTSLENEGFLLARGAVSPASCDRLDEFLEQFPMKTVVDWGVRFSKDCIANNPQTIDLLGAPLDEYSGSGSSILYDEVVETIDTFSGSYPLHQDSAYFPKASVSLVLALSPLGKDRGGLSIYPRSNQKGSLPHHEGDFGLEVMEASKMKTKMKMVTLQRGDLALIHPHLVHVVTCNRTKDMARLLSVTLGTN